MRVAACLVMMCSLLAGAARAAVAADPTPVRVNAFPGIGNLAIFVGQAKGIFARHGLAVDLQFTPNSPDQRAGLAKGAFEIAHAAVDNAVAMVELTGADTVIVMGGDSSLQELFAQPFIQSVADLRGKTVIVDAPNTAYALMLKKILLLGGVKPGEYTVKPTGGTASRFGLMKENKEHAATMLNPPYSILATREGLRSLGLGVTFIGRYQAVGAFVMRPWAHANSATLERYIAGYVESLRWALNPANKTEASALIGERLKLPADVAAATWERAADPVGGLTPDAKFDLEGFRNALALRAEIEGQWGGKPPAPDKYYDLQYYERALKTLTR